MARIQIQLKDLEALKMAANALGMEFIENVQNYKWFGRYMRDTNLPEGVKESDLGKCNHVIRIPGNSKAYEVGVVKGKDGKNWELMYDFWAGGYGLEEKIGPQGQKLIQEYSAAVTQKYYQKKGFRLTKTIKENGKIVLIAVK